MDSVGNKYMEASIQVQKLLQQSQLTQSMAIFLFLALFLLPAAPRAKNVLPFTNSCLGDRYLCFEVRGTPDCKKHVQLEIDYLVEGGPMFDPPLNKLRLQMANLGGYLHRECGTSSLTGVVYLHDRKILYVKATDAAGWYSEAVKVSKKPLDPKRPKAQKPPTKVRETQVPKSMSDSDKQIGKSITTPTPQNAHEKSTKTPEPEKGKETTGANGHERKNDTAYSYLIAGAFLLLFIVVLLKNRRGKGKEEADVHIDDVMSTWGDTPSDKGYAGASTSPGTETPDIDQVMREYAGERKHEPNSSVPVKVPVNEMADPSENHGGTRRNSERDILLQRLYELARGGEIEAAEAQLEQAHEANRISDEDYMEFHRFLANL